MNHPPESSLAGAVAATVRAEMARRNIKQTKLADDLGWTQPKAARRLKGESQIPWNDLPEIAGVLKMTVPALMAAIVTTYEVNQREAVAA